MVERGERIYNGNDACGVLLGICWDVVARGAENWCAAIVFMCQVGCGTVAEVEVGSGNCNEEIRTVSK